MHSMAQVDRRAASRCRTGRCRALVAGFCAKHTVENAVANASGVSFIGQRTQSRTGWLAEQACCARRGEARRGQGQDASDAMSTAMRALLTADAFSRRNVVKFRFNV